MNNTIKIGLILILISIFLGNASASTFQNGTVTVSGDITVDISMPHGVTERFLNSDYFHCYLHTDIQENTGVPDTIEYENVRTYYTGDYDDIAQNVGGPLIIYDGTVEVGTGMLYLRKQSDLGGSIAAVDWMYYFDDGFIPDDNKVYRMTIFSSIIYNYYTRMFCNQNYGADHPYEFNTLKIGIQTIELGNNMYSHGEHTTTTGDITYSKTIDAQNDFSLEFHESMVRCSIDRTFIDKFTESRFLVRDSSGALYYSSGYVTVDDTYYFVNDTQSFYIQFFGLSTEHLLYTSVVEDPEDPGLASISFNKNIYNTTDQMIITYDNLDHLDSSEIIYDLQFYRYVSYNEIEYSINIPLRGSLDPYNDIAYVTLHGTNPGILYYAIIDRDISYKQSKTNFLANTKLTGSINVTHPYEYVSISCQGDYCQYNNGDSFIITYNALDDYQLFVNDSNGDIVRNLGNISGFGNIEFTIPFDDYKSYTYPNWETGFNDTDIGFYVYWLEQSDYNEYVSDDTDVDTEVEENIVSMREACDPIKDLLIGLSGIIIENPDYDNNGIVASDELDQWFNGIIGLLLVIVIYIFYKGLKDR